MYINTPEWQGPHGVPLPQHAVETCTTISVLVTGCSLNLNSPIDDPAELRIIIDIPNPDNCVDVVENLSRKSVFSEL